MTLPGSFNKVTVTGTYTTLTGELAKGKVTFTPDSKTWLTATAEKVVIVPRTITADLTNGTFAVDLPATDDPDILPNGGTYVVTEVVGTDSRTYSIQVPVGSGPIDLATVAPVQPVTATSRLVTSVNGVKPNGAGAISLTPASIGAVATDDPQLTDTRTPKSHAASHATGGSDPISPASIGALDQAAGDARYAPQVEPLRPVLSPKGAPPLMTVPANIAGHAWTKTGGQGVVDLADTTDVLWGSQAIKVTTPGTNVTDCHVTASGLTLDLTGRDPALWVKVDDIAQLRALEVRLGDATFANFFYFEFESNLAAARNDRYLRSGHWHRLTLPWGAKGVDTGTPNRAAITQVRVSPLDYGTGPATVHIAGFGHQPQATEYPNGVCCFTFDDGFATQFTVARPYLDRYGFPATALPIVDLVGLSATYMTVAQLKQLQDVHGWDIGAHANTAAAHNAVGAFTSLSADTLAAELRLNKMWLRANGFRGYDLHAYPQGLYNDAVISAVGSYYGVSRSQHSYRRDTLPPAEPLRLRTFNLGFTQTLASAKAAVDEASANKELLIYTLHQLISPATTGSHWTPSDFQALVDYVASKGMAVRTLSDALRRI